MIVENKEIFDWLEANADRYKLHGYFSRGTKGVDEAILPILMKELDDVNLENTDKPLSLRQSLNKAMELLEALTADLS